MSSPAISVVLQFKDDGLTMTRLLQPLFALLTVATDQKLRLMVEYLKEENSKHYYRSAA